MTHTTKNHQLLELTLLTLTFAAIALAMFGVTSARANEVVLDAVLVTHSESRALPFRAPVSAAALDTHRGGDSQVNENRLRANLGDNSASNLTTGMNAITDGSFGQASGFPMLIQNTGNNVIIQNSTILNLTVK